MLVVVTIVGVRDKMDSAEELAHAMIAACPGLKQIWMRWKPVGMLRRTTAHMGYCFWKDKGGNGWSHNSKQWLSRTIDHDVLIQMWEDESGISPKEFRI
jgi:hypothetical protein